MPDNAEGAKGGWLYDQAERETKAISERLQAELDKWPLIHFLTRHFGSLLFGASQRLIDRKVKTKEERLSDEAVIESCARLYSECYSGYLLVRNGLILQSIVLLRSAFEITTQALLFMQREDMAVKWLKGKKIKPQQVRDLTSMPETERKLYEKLSNLAHPNYNAFRYFAVPVPRKGTLGKAYAYGGWFAPKEAGQIAIQFLWAQLVFLEKFYQVYSDDLRVHGLLWRTETIEKAFGDKPVPEDFTWDQYLGGWRAALTRLAEDHAKNMPADVLEASLALSDYTPEEKEQFRKGFEDTVQSLSDSRQHKPGTASLPDSDG